MKAQRFLFILAAWLLSFPQSKANQTDYMDFPSSQTLRTMVLDVESQSLSDFYDYQVSFSRSASAGPGVPGENIVGGGNNERIRENPVGEGLVFLLFVVGAYFLIRYKEENRSRFVRAQR